MTMWTSSNVGMKSEEIRMNISLYFHTLHSYFEKAWHIRYDWSFTPFVVVVGGKYFLPVPECLLFGRES
jgi:hypothetical protein